MPYKCNLPRWAVSDLIPDGKIIVYSSETKAESINKDEVSGQLGTKITNKTKVRCYDIDGKANS